MERSHLEPRHRHPLQRRGENQCRRKGLAECDNERVKPVDPEPILERIRAYLLEPFPSVTIAPHADAKTGSALIHILQGRTRWAVEITHTFLDADVDRPEPLAALRKWDLIGVLKRTESGSIVRVTTTGLRVV